MSAQALYLRIDQVSKRFGTFRALTDISLAIKQGEFVCFLGPSGCGKTTLLRAIAGLDLQSSGRIFQGDKDISLLPPAARDFGIVFQSYALFPNLTVAKNVAYGLSRLPRRKVGQRVAELLELVGLADQGSKYPAQLSGGQQQRVALARALATSPGLLLLDEPLSALDAKVRVHLRHEIKQLQRRLGITTVMVTHDQEEALTMADRIVVMNEGLIEQVGSPEDVYGRPETAFVADFVGAMNFLPATVQAVGELQMGGAKLKCATDDWLASDSVSVAFRPEDLVLAETAQAVDNTLQARVESLDFLGSYFRAVLTLSALPERQMLADFSVNLIRRTGLVEGASVAVSLPAERIRLFAATNPAGV